MENISNLQRQEEMFALVKSCKESGKSNKEFCKQQHISEAIFYYWQKKYRETVSITRDGFLPIKVEKPLNCLNEIEICYPNGVHVKLPQGFDMSVIRSFICIL
jgi:putative transposase